MPEPSVGRVVHYVSYGTPGGEYPSVCRAAIITDVGAWMPHSYSIEAAEPPPVDEQGRPLRRAWQVWEAEACALTVHNPTGLFFNTCRHDEGGTSDTPGAPAARSYLPGTWHWPERTET